MAFKPEEFPDIVRHGGAGAVRRTKLGIVCLGDAIMENLAVVLYEVSAVRPYHIRDAKVLWLVESSR